MNNIGIDNNYNPLIKHTFENSTDKEKTISFMIKYFQNYVINEGRKYGYDFKKCLDIVNSELLTPVRLILKERPELTYEKKKRIDLWNHSHQEYEKLISIELIKIGSNVEKAELLFKNDPLHSH